jgi:hypothetical protein
MIPRCKLGEKTRDGVQLYIFPPDFDTVESVEASKKEILMAQKSAIQEYERSQLDRATARREERPLQVDDGVMRMMNKAHGFQSTQSSWFVREGTLPIRRSQSVRSDSWRNQGVFCMNYNGEECQGLCAELIALCRNDLWSDLPHGPMSGSDYVDDGNCLIFVSSLPFVYRKVQVSRNTLVSVDTKNVKPPPSARSHSRTSDSRLAVHEKKVTLAKYSKPNLSAVICVTCCTSRSYHISIDHLLPYESFQRLIMTEVSS